MNRNDGRTDFALFPASVTVSSHSLYWRGTLPISLHFGCHKVYLWSPYTANVTVPEYQKKKNQETDM